MLEQSMSSKYSLQEAQQDFGPCGSILHALTQCSDPADMDMNLLFGLEACWNQHRAKLLHNQEQAQHIAMMQSVFTVSQEALPPCARQAREAAYKINWILKIREMK